MFGEPSFLQKLLNSSWKEYARFQQAARELFLEGKEEKDIINAGILNAMKFLKRPPTETETDIIRMAVLSEKLTLKQEGKLK